VLLRGRDLSILTIVVGFMSGAPILLGRFRFLAFLRGFSDRFLLGAARWRLCRDGAAIFRSEFSFLA